MKPRKPHGAGAKVDPVAPRLEHVPPDEQPYPPTTPDAIATGRDTKGRVRSPEAARALAKLPRRKDVLPAAISCHPDFAAHYRRRLEWRNRRRAELVTIGRGHMSNGVGTRLNMAAWLWAGSEFAAELGAKEASLQLLATAADLGAKADRLDWSAYHMAVREAQARAAAQGPADPLFSRA